MKRSPKAMLSPAEVEALVCLRRGRVKVMRREHEDLLLSMGLVRVSKSGGLKLTEDGLRRLGEAGEDCLPTAEKNNPFSPMAARRNPFDPPSRD